MKRKAEESCATNASLAFRQGSCRQPSTLCDSGDRFSTKSISSNASDDTFSLSSSPYMFMNLDAGVTSTRQHSVERGADVNNAIIGDIGGGESAEAIAKVDGEKLLASEMQALSVNEREEIYEEIHIGVRKNVEESPEFIEEKLRLFEQQLITRHQPKPKREPRDRHKQHKQNQQSKHSAAAKEPYKYPSAYQQALFLAPRYVKDPNFRILFLRSESFDVTKAAAKFVKHFESKKKFFGADKLGKAIDFFDLDEEDVTALRNGSIHIPPNFRDRSGRCVLFDNFHCYRSTNDAEYKTQVRLIWYAFMREMEKNTEAQCRGTIAVVYAIGVSSRELTQLIVEQRRNPVVPSLPLLGICGHVCLDNPQLRPLSSIFLATTPKALRLRARIHFGSGMECQYALSTYGITSDLLPYASDGSVKRDKMEQVVATFQTEDDKHRTHRIRQETSQGIASYATSLDVLQGKGAPYQNSKGTLRMQQLVEQSMPQYISAKDDRFAKTILFLDIVHTMKRSGGRFLKRHARYNEGVSNFQKVAASSQESVHEQQTNEDDPDAWVVLDDEAAREKVAFAFRNNIRRLKNQKSVLAD